MKKHVIENRNRNSEGPLHTNAIGGADLLSVMSCFRDTIKY